MNTKVQTGDFVHPLGDTSIIYEVMRVRPVWYVGRNNVDLRNINESLRGLTVAPAYMLVQAEPELLL